MYQEKDIAKLKPAVMSTQKVYHNWCNFYVTIAFLVCLCISLASIYCNFVLHGMLKEVNTRQLGLERRVDSCKLGREFRKEVTRERKTYNIRDRLQLNEHEDLFGNISGSKASEIIKRNRRDTPPKTKTRKRQRKDVRGISYLLESSTVTEFGEDGIFTDWSTPIHSRARRRSFDLYIYSDGKITIREDGIYYIYAQVTYFTNYPTVSYSVYKDKEGNEKCIAKCVVSIPNDDQGGYRHGSCYIAKSAALSKGDKIYIKDEYAAHSHYSREVNHFSSQPELTYWGIIRIH